MCESIAHAFLAALRLASTSEVDEQGDTASPNCNYLNGLWEKSALMRRGYCLRGVCMSRVPSEILKDPNVVPLSCDEFATENGSYTAIGEFKQDWFIYWNFFRNNGPAPRVDGRERAGVYVDIGASLPFEYSNTVAFDRCFGWRGVCVEPNPHLAHFLRAYRSCEVFERWIVSTMRGPRARHFRIATATYSSQRIA
ncbi:unnamed protein product [Prorocentrum cordatum]|uniref:Methyltransferase FkbM domain-containing protein n=1 Tax=Prorocentrum cordatum TaxID=2364126 RepID=A0ABN9SIH4_9DINO|nr:unnamed protein product [Polarella glacialis]